MNGTLLDTWQQARTHLRANLTAGDNSPVGGEIQRLTSLRNQLLEAAGRLDALRIDGWSGSTADAFETSRNSIGLEIYRAADLHGDAVEHLAGYDSVWARVMALTDEIRSGWHGGLPPDVAEHLAWLQSQLREAGCAAAVHIRAAADSLADVRRRLPELPSSPVNAGAPAVRDVPKPPAPAMPATTPQLDLSTAAQHVLLAELRRSPHFLIDLPDLP